MFTTTASSLSVTTSGGPHAQSDEVRTELDLQEHLVLVGHVVKELALRVPSHIDRSAMFAHGAMGLLVAARRHDPHLDDFAHQALRSIRASIIGNLANQSAAPSDGELSSLLDVPVLALRAARASATSTAPVVHRPATAPTAPTASFASPARPAFIGA